MVRTHLLQRVYCSGEDHEGNKRLQIGDGRNKTYCGVDDDVRDVMHFNDDGLVEVSE